MDEIDAANELAERYRQSDLAAHFQRRRDESPQRQADARPSPGDGAGPGGGRIADACCCDCGAEIPAARRAANANATRCVACQTEHERRR